MSAWSSLSGHWSKNEENEQKLSLRRPDSTLVYPEYSSVTFTLSDLIDSETDGLQVEPLLAQSASVLLHEGHDDAALIVFIHIL